MNKGTKERPKEKEKYKVKNWKQYNESLKKRGSLTVWFSEDVEKGWIYKGPQKPGGKVEYSDIAIEFCLKMRSFFRLGYRQTQGFVSSLLEKVDINNLKCPSYSQINRRSGELKVKIRKEEKKEGSINILVDSTGLKVYGEGEWKVRKHGASKRRTWRKVHIAVNPEDLEIVSVELTENSVDDASMVEPLLEGAEQEVAQLIGDGGYDREKVYKVLTEKGIKGIIPPQNNAVVHEDKVWDERNKAIRRIEEIGRKEWKQEAGYHRRSLVEVSMNRYKTIFGGELQSRKPKYEKTEVNIKCKMLNRMRELGMPISYKVGAA